MHVSHAAANQDKLQIYIWHPQREKMEGGREENEKKKQAIDRGFVFES